MPAGQGVLAVSARFGHDVSEGIRRRYSPVETAPPLTDAERKDDFEEDLAKERSGILNWALDNGDSMDEVLEILEALDINSRRIEFLLASRLSHGN